ncbi:MAG: response regulator transcription factor [Gordonibacter sp.]|nr:response regulator transcription factor [Gordonibacter sp.]
MPKVMLVDDDESMQTLVGQIVQGDGYEFCGASNGSDGLDMLRVERPDFLILDVMLPDINGFEICDIIRSEGRKVPIMFLSAKGDIVDKSIGFKAGADDYLVKPFQPEELLLRIRAHLRRKSRDADAPLGTRSRERKSYKVGDLELNFGRYEVYLRGKPISLSSREFELLELLASDPGNVFTRDQILTHVWGGVDAADPNSVTVFVRKIREKIEDDPSKPRYLVTVWRVGYKVADRAAFESGKL